MAVASPARKQHGHLPFSQALSRFKECSKITLQTFGNQTAWALAKSDEGQENEKVFNPSLPNGVPRRAPVTRRTEAKARFERPEAGDDLCSKRKLVSSGKAGHEGERLHERLQISRFCSNRRSDTLSLAMPGTPNTVRQKLLLADLVLEDVKDTHRRRKLLLSRARFRGIL